MLQPQKVHRYLCQELDAYLHAQGLPQQCAFELAHDDDDSTTTEQQAWLLNFCERWDNTEQAMLIEKTHKASGNPLWFADKIEVSVYIEGKRAGTIREFNGGFAYFPKGNKGHGEPYPTVERVKLSLVMDIKL